jgi:DnaK suppressor protein
MDAIQQQKMSAANKASAERTLKQVAAALRAAAEDDYGFCKRCDEPIGYRRLKARPETPLCLGCQSAAEKSRA